MAIVKMNRPARRNAMDSILLSGLLGKLERLRSDPEVEAAVITGGQEVFSAGADVSERLDAGAALARMRMFGRLYEMVATYPKPTVAAIAGAGVGGGAELAACCDLRVGAPSASIRFPGAQFGVPVGAARLPLLIGLSHAKDLLMTNRAVGAEGDVPNGLSQSARAPGGSRARGGRPGARDGRKPRGRTAEAFPRRGNRPDRENPT